MKPDTPPSAWRASLLATCLLALAWPFATLAQEAVIRKNLPER